MYVCDAVGVMGLAVLFEKVIASVSAALTRAPTMPKPA